MTKNEDLKAFDAWADDYLKREYPFYTTGAIADVCRALKSQLYAAWKAGAETRPTVTPTDGDAERFLDGIVTAYCHSLGMEPPTPDRDSQTEKQVRIIKAALQSTRKPENKMNPTIQVDDYVVDAQSVRNLIEQRDVAEKKLAAMPDAVNVSREVLQGVREAKKILMELTAHMPRNSQCVVCGCSHNSKIKQALASLDAVLEGGE